MKSLISILTVLVLLCAGTASFAQAKKEMIKVAGECGTCKKKIEGAARKAGAQTASWDVDSKVLTVSYNSTSTNTAKIQRSIAAAGYDSPGYRATDKAYNKLDACCQYDRAGASAAACCDSKACQEKACMKNGKCAPNMACCKDSGCSEKACCKKS